MPPRSGRIPFGLPLLAANALVVYASFAYFFPLRPHYSERLADVRTFAPSMAAGLLYASAVTVAFAVCWLAHRWILSGRVEASLRTILLSSALLAAPLLAVYPINANDIFRYYLRGQITAQYGASPFVNSPADFPDQPYHHLAGEWAKKTSPYGPVWEAAAAATVRATGGDLLHSIVAFKALGLFCHLSIGWLLFQILAGIEPRRRQAMTILWAWNPAALLMFVVDAHNDAAMISLLLLGAWLLEHRHRENAGFAVLTLAALTKMSAVLALVFFAAQHLASQRSLQQAMRATARLAGIVVACTLIAFLPFGGIDTAALDRILDESQSASSFSPLAAIRYLGQTIDGFSPNMRLWTQAASASYLVAIAALLIATARGRPAVRGIADAFLFYFYSAARFRIWYPLWALPWTLLDERRPTSWSRARTALVFAMLWASQVSVVLYGHGYVHLLGRSRALAHFLGVALVFAIPAAWAMLRWRRPPRQRPPATGLDAGDAA